MVASIFGVYFKRKQIFSATLELKMPNYAIDWTKKARTKFCESAKLGPAFLGQSSRRSAVRAKRRTGKISREMVNSK